MKNTLLALLLVTTSVLAQTEQDVVKQLDSINKMNVSAVTCPSCQKDDGLVTPLRALEEANSGKLTFLGRDLFPGSDQNRSCVYKSESAYILYNNCMANKKESVLDITIISFNGGISHYYVENNMEQRPTSTIRRSDYDLTWSVDFVPSEAPGKLDVAGLKRYSEKYGPGNGGCFIGSTFKAKDPNQKAICYGAMKEKGESWKAPAEKFWSHPDELWYETQRTLRKAVLASKF